MQNNNLLFILFLKKKFVFKLIELFIIINKKFYETKPLKKIVFYY